jgi:hypothetical protein
LALGISLHKNGKILLKIGAPYCSRKGGFGNCFSKTLPQAAYQKTTFTHSLIFNLALPSQSCHHFESSSLPQQLHSFFFQHDPCLLLACDFSVKNITRGIHQNRLAFHFFHSAENH